MKFLTAVLCLASIAMAAGVAVNVLGGAYNFGYSAEDELQSYIDASRNRRTADYNAGTGGFQATGDTGVDRRTAAIAAVMAALEPGAPAAVPVGDAVSAALPYGYLGHPQASVNGAGYVAHW